MIVKANIALSDNGFVFNPATGDSFTLNETGKVVLTLIKDGKSLKQITNFMKEEYDVDEVTLDRYLADFVNDLRVNNLLEE
ncbi:MAG TPA: PqqD family protein [Williamwhitmania sp.]|nr:PqqD family protein [Williamwhitmania sp.]